MGSLVEENSHCLEKCCCLEKVKSSCHFQQIPLDWASVGNFQPCSPLWCNHSCLTLWYVLRLDTLSPQGLSLDPSPEGRALQATVQLCETIPASLRGCTRCVTRLSESSKSELLAFLILAQTGAAHPRLPQVSLAQATSRGQGVQSQARGHSRPQETC